MTLEQSRLHVRSGLADYAGAGQASKRPLLPRTGRARVSDIFAESCATRGGLLRCLR
jgi:hypothetical protein